MEKFKGKYRIETARAKWWNYNNAGKYFITICAKDREHLFGIVKNGEMILNDYGKIVAKCWFDLPNHYPNIELDAFQIMPNHIHCIVSVILVGTVETGLKPVCTSTDIAKIAVDNAADNPDLKKKEIKIHGVFEFIRALKSFSSRRINELRNSKGVANWQERFHDHIIRNDEEYHRIKNYIINNPKKWSEDCHFTK